MSNLTKYHIFLNIFCFFGRFFLFSCTVSFTNIFACAVSFTNVFAPSGRIHWEFVAKDLPPFFRKKTLKNGVRASYSIIPVTTPEPTVLPPSLIANLKPSSIAIGWINSTINLELSPGIHISTPSSRSICPVISVVLK